MQTVCKRPETRQKTNRCRGRSSTHAMPFILDSVLSAAKTGFQNFSASGKTMNAQRQSNQDTAFALAFGGILLLSVAIISLTFRVNALERAQAQQRPEQPEQQSSPQPKSIYQRNQRGQAGQLNLLFQPFCPLSFREGFDLYFLCQFGVCRLDGEQARFPLRRLTQGQRGAGAFARINTCEASLLCSAGRRRFFRPSSHLAQLFRASFNSF